MSYQKKEKQNLFIKIWLKWKTLFGLEVSCFKASVSIQIILEKMYSFQFDLHTDDFLIYLFYFSHEFFSSRPLSMV